MEAIAAYMSHECACPKEDYKGRLMESILEEALFDYLNSANKPGFDLRNLFHQYALSDPSLSERICTMFQLVTVRDDSGQYTNGFTDKLMAQSEIDLGRMDMPVGICIVQLMQDSVDNVWFDFCQYQLWKTGVVVVPFGWNLTNPADFCKQFLFPQAEYVVLSSGKNHKKPQELCGIMKFASVSFGKCKCQLFLKGDDLYINHHDYFSWSWRPPADDLGKPTTYYLKKYFGIARPEKFCYADCWGDIVLQNKAWLRITNFVPMVKILNAPQIAKKVWPMIREYHNWPSCEQNTDWEQFLDCVAVTTKNYLMEVPT